MLFQSLHCSVGFYLFKEATVGAIARNFLSLSHFCTVTSTGIAFYSCLFITLGVFVCAADLATFIYGVLTFICDEIVFYGRVSK